MCRGASALFSSVKTIKERVKEKQAQKAALQQIDDSTNTSQARKGCCSKKQRGCCATRRNQHATTDESNHARQGQVPETRMKQDLQQDEAVHIFIEDAPPPYDAEEKVLLKRVEV